MIGQGLRQAARLMHRLTEADRSWILGQLSASERDALRSALAADPISAPLQAAMVEALKESDTHALARASVDEMTELLLPEPDWLVGAVLAQRDWPWTESFLARLPADRLARLAAARGLAATLPPRVTAALLARCEARLPSRTIKPREPESAFDRFVAAAVRGGTTTQAA